MSADFDKDRLVNWLTAEGNRRRDLRIYFCLLPVYLGTVVWLIYALEPHYTLHMLSVTLGYYSLCCTFIPLPTTAIMVWLNMPDVDLSPLVVATVASVGTTFANLFDYHVITFLMGYNLIGRARRTKLYRVADRWFSRHPLLTITLWNMVPFSLDIARWLACMRGYSRPRFMLGTFLGRWPRYVLIGCATRLFWFDEFVVGVLLVMTLTAGIIRAAAYLWHFLRQRRKLNSEHPPDSVSEGAVSHDDVVARVGP